MSTALRHPRLHVDWTRCDGHGLCARLLAERVTLDEWGFPIVDGELDDAELVAAARLAARSCPALALRVESGT
jgi:ferredoxin